VRAADAQRSALQVSFMIIPVPNRSLLCPLVLTLLVVCNGACEVDTRVAIVDEHNPPKFKLSGNGTLITLFVYGPYSSVEGFKGSPFEVEPVWEFGVGLPGVKIRDLPVISYGETPVGFYQVFPKEGPPPALEEGKYYMVTPLSGNANWEALCFKPKGEKVEEVLCH